MKKAAFRTKSCFCWQPKKDSNPHKQSQSLSCYHYTIRLSFFVVCLATLLVYNEIPDSSIVFYRKNKKIRRYEMKVDLQEKGEQNFDFTSLFRILSPFPP